MSGRSTSFITAPVLDPAGNYRHGQVSGRSDIVDFEEIVRLDTQYINDWSLGLI